MKFKDVQVCREEFFSLGIEEESGKYYLSIPVSTRMHIADYEEYYEIDRSAFECYRADPKAALDFVTRCRNKEMGHLLIFPKSMSR